MRKRYTIVATVLAGLLALSSVAYAAEETDQATNVVIDGIGKLVAEGRGHVEIVGKGWVRMAMHGDVAIAIGDDTEIHVQPAGEGSDLVQGPATLSLEDFTGVIVVRGADFNISAQGTFRRISAAGKGIVFLQGRGWYRATGGDFGTWTKPDVRVTYNL